MSKESFRDSIFRAIKFINKYELSDQSKKLIIHYFNKSKSPTSAQKAIDAIEFYLQVSIPTLLEERPRLKVLLEEMKAEADSWDRE